MLTQRCCSSVGQSQQLSGLSSLVVNLKSCLEIMNLKREEMSVAFAAVEGMDLDIKQSMAFCQDAVELEIPIYVSPLARAYVSTLRYKRYQVHVYLVSVHAGELLDFHRGH